MNIEKELEVIFDDPLLKMSEEEELLFDVPQDMRRVMAKKQADYVAQHTSARTLRTTNLCLKRCIRN